MEATIARIDASNNIGFPACGVGWLRLALLVTVALVIGGTLTPFDFSAGTIQAALTAGATPLVVHSPGLEDTLINLLLYMPIGMLAFSVARSRGQSRPISLLRAVAMGGGLSLALELIQFGIPSRVSSLNDVILNLASAGLGIPAGAAVRRLLATWGKRFTRMPYTALSGVAVAALLLSSLAPFRLVTSDAALWGRFHDIRWGLLAAPTFASSSLAPSLESLLRLLHSVGWSLCFAACGYFCGRAALQSGESQEIALLSASANGLALLCVTATLSLLCGSAPIYVDTLAATGVAVIFGSWYATLRTTRAEAVSQ